MTYLVERLVELRKHLTHLREIRPRVRGISDLEDDLSLHNDVLFSLFTVCQMVIDIAGELSARRMDRFEDYTHAVRNLRLDSRFPTDLVDDLVGLPGFRNVVVHDYVTLDYAKVLEALDKLDPLERFAEIVRSIELEKDGD